MNTEASELIDLLFTLQSRLQFFWNFYFGTVLALLAFISNTGSGDRNLHANYPLKIAITLIFALFAIGNFDGLWKYAKMAGETLQSLRQVVKYDSNGSKVAQIVAKGMNFRFTMAGILIGHIVGNLIVFCAVWFYLNPNTN